ncbi:hypothetical protein [Imbroritus primus]|uniref:hypothetical protein n=1 Tax=Imbroritus primus TaxID=3058603 RepID=UPI003D161769
MQFRTLIADRQDIDAVRHAAMQLAIRCGFSERASERLDDTVASAAACLLSRLGDRGELLIRPLREEVSGLAAPRIEVLALERYAPDEGAGLALLAPIAEAFTLHCTPGRGHIARMVVPPSERFSPVAADIAVGAICVPRAQEVTRCQPWHIEFMPPGGFNLTLLHGLGHGPDAHQLTTAAHRAAGACGAATPAIIAERVRSALGSNLHEDVALGVATLDTQGDHLCFAGGGGIRALIDTPDTERYVQPSASPNGVTGTEMQWPAGSLLVLYCGDLDQDARLPDRETLATLHPAIAAALLYRDFLAADGEGTVVVCRHEAAARTVSSTTSAAQDVRLEEN